MPNRPRRRCAYPGCTVVFRPEPRQSYCVKHEQQRVQVTEARRRDTSTRKLYGNAWRKASRAYLKQHPLCVYCEREGVVKPARVVDHIIPHRGDERLFWDQSNWQPLCFTHHNRDKQREEKRGDRAVAGDLPQAQDLIKPSVKG